MTEEKQIPNAIPYRELVLNHKPDITYNHILPHREAVDQVHIRSIAYIFFPVPIPVSPTLGGNTIKELSFRFQNSINS